MKVMYNKAVNVANIALMAEVCIKFEFWYDNFANIGSIAHIKLAINIVKVPIYFLCILTSPKILSLGMGPFILSGIEEISTSFFALIKFNLLSQRNDEIKLKRSASYFASCARA